MNAATGGALLLGVLVALTAGMYYAASSFQGHRAPPVYGTLDATGCSTTGRWTVARFTIKTLTEPVLATDLAASDPNSARSTRDATDPLQLSTRVPTLGAGNRIWLATQAGRTTDLVCDGAQPVTFLHIPSGEILAATRARSGAPTYPLALSDVTCIADDAAATVSFTIERAPPGLAKQDVSVQDLATGASTEATGGLKLTLSGASNPLKAGDEVTLSTKHNHPEALSCSDTISFVDIPSSAQLRTLTLTPGG